MDVGLKSSYNSTYAHEGYLLTARMRLQQGIAHYAWIVLAVTFLVQGISSAMRMAFGTFVEPLSAAFNCGVGAIGIAFSIQFLVAAAVAPVAGWLGEAYGVRKTVFMGVILFIVGMGMTGPITELWQFYLFYGVVLGSALSILGVPMVTVVTYWFKKYQGVAVGVTFSAYGLGPVIFAPVIAYVIRYYGWQIGMISTAVVGGGLMLLAASFFYSKPADRGLLPLGATEDEGMGTQSDPLLDKARANAFFNRARATFNFWNLANIHLLGCIGHAIIIVYIASLAVNRGIDQVQAAGVIAIFAGVSGCTRFLAPVLSDYMSPKTVMFVSYFLQGVTVLLLLNADSIAQFYFFAVVFGIGYGGEGPVFPLLNRRYYRDAPVSIAYGWQIFGANIGMALGGWLGGFLFDVTGDYTATIILSASVSVLGAFCILLLTDPNKPLIPDWADNIVVKKNPATS